MKKRIWIDLLLFYATVSIIVSGIVLYIMPHGRIAYWSGWSFLGIDKDGWDNLHVIFGILMVIVAVWHIIVNWKTMKKYLIKKESIISLVIISAMIIGSIINIQPFKSIIDLEDYIKNSWEVNKQSLPFAHAELMRLDEFCKKTNIPLNQAIKNLKSKNITFQTNQTLKSIAKQNNLTPVKIYTIIQEKNNSFMGKGYGRMSLEEVCKSENINIQKALNKLKSHNIKANKTENLKDIATKNNLMPIDVIEIITK